MVGRACMEKSIKNVRNNWFYFLSVIAWTIFYCYYHTKIWVSSDHVTMIPFAKDFLSGNLLLKGWVAGSNNFFFTETLFYLPGLALGVSGYTLEAVLSSLTMALIVVEASAFFLRQKGFLYVLVYYAIVGMVPVGMSHILINSNSHNGLYAVLLLEFWILLKYIESESNRYGLVIAYMVIGVLALYSDSVALMGLIAPVLCLCAYMILLKRKNTPELIRWMIMFWATAFIFVLAKLFSRVIRMLGGIVTLGYPTKLVGLAEAKVRAIEWFGQVEIVWGYTPWGAGFFGHCYHVAIVGIMVLFGISIAYFFIKAVLFRIDYKALLAWLIVVINLGGCVFTNADIHPRYCVLSFIFGVILVLYFVFDVTAICEGKKSQSSNNKISVIRVVAIVLSLFFTISVSWYRGEAIIKMQPYTYLTETQNAADFILENNLGTGYGQFWCGPIIAAMTDYKYNILPIYTSEDGFKEYSNLVNTRWYDETEIHYTVTFQNDDENDDVGVKNEEIIGFLGEPDWIKDIYNYRIMYWDKDISQWMVK